MAGAGAEDGAAAVDAVGRKQRCCGWGMFSGKRRAAQQLQRAGRSSTCAVENGGCGGAWTAWDGERATWCQILDGPATSGYLRVCTRVQCIPCPTTSELKISLFFSRPWSSSVSAASPRAPSLLCPSSDRSYISSVHASSISAVSGSLFVMRWLHVMAHKTMAPDGTMCETSCCQYKHTVC